MYANFLHPPFSYCSTVTSPFVSCLGGVAITCEQRIRLISLSSAFFSSLSLSLDPDLNAEGQRLSHSLVACCRPPVRSRLLRLFILGGGETEESPWLLDKGSQEPTGLVASPAAPLNRQWKGGREQGKTGQRKSRSRSHPLPYWPMTHWEETVYILEQTFSPARLSQWLCSRVRKRVSLSTCRRSKSVLLLQRLTQLHEPCWFSMCSVSDLDLLLPLRLTGHTSRMRHIVTCITY